MTHLDIPPVAPGDRYRGESQRDLPRADLEDMFGSDEPSIGGIVMGIAVAYLIGLLGAMVFL